MLNNLTNARIDAGSTAIDDIADMVAMHNEAIDGLADMVATEESEVEQ